jgi:hypothetical protein
MCYVMFIIFLYLVNKIFTSEFDSNRASTPLGYLPKFFAVVYCLQANPILSVTYS